MNTQVMMMTGVAALLGLLVCLLPAKALRAGTSLFTMQNFGIRKIKRWHTTTDTLGNFLETVCVLFCIVYPLIPGYWYLYMVLIVLAGLCALSRAAVIAVHQKQTYGRLEMKVVVFFLWMVMACGFLAGSGLYNGQIFSKPIETLVTTVLAGGWDDLLYYITNVDLFYYLLQAAIMMVPLCVLWNQFKYMRLERTYKSLNLFTFVVKNVIILAILVMAGSEGFALLNSIYRVGTSHI